MKLELCRTLIFLWIICSTSTAYAESSNRIEDILHRETVSSNGEGLASEMQASVEGCRIRLYLDKPRACQIGASFSSVTTYIDLRALITDRGNVVLREPSDPRYESLGGSASYQYQPQYDQTLRLAYSQYRQILEEEKENFPTNVEARLRTLSQRNREEIAPELYGMSFETVQFCSGVEVSSPLRSRSFRFYMEPSEMEEFAVLVENLAQTCKTEFSS